MWLWSLDKMKNIIVLLALLGIFKTGDAVITGWTTPSITGSADGNGALSVNENQAMGTTIETYEANTVDTPVTYSLVDAVPPFELSSGGVLTIAAALDFETTPSYTLEIRAVDDAETPGSGTATIAVTVVDVSVAPAFDQSTYSTTIADSAAAGTTVFTVTATDQDSGDMITYSIASGDTNSHFDIGSSTGEITVNSDVTLVACTKYALQIEATDDEDPPRTGTTTLNVEVTPCSGAAMTVVSTALILFAAVLAILQ